MRRITWLGIHGYSHAFEDLHSPITCTCKPSVMPPGYYLRPFIDVCKRIPSRLKPFCEYKVNSSTLGAWLVNSGYPKCRFCEQIANGIGMDEMHLQRIKLSLNGTTYIHYH